MLLASTDLLVQSLLRLVLITTVFVTEYLQAVCIHVHQKDNSLHTLLSITSLHLQRTSGVKV